MFTASEDPVYTITLDGPDALRDLGYYNKTRNQSVSRTELRYRLAARPDLGALFLTSSSFAFLAQLREDGVFERLVEIDGPAKAALEIRTVTFTARRGAYAGKKVTAKRPVLSILGPLAD